MSACSDTPGIDHGGGKGMAELVTGHMADAGLFAGPVEFESQRLLAEPSAVVGEEELGRRPVRGCGSGRPSRAGGDDPVDQGDGLLVEGHHPLGVEFAERDFQPGAVAGDLVHAVELEVQQFADTQPARSWQEQRVGGQPEIGALQRLAEAPVGVDGQVAREAAWAGAGYRSGR